MRILLLADRSFASRERRLLHRVEVGLIDDGVRVVRAIPDTLLYTQTDSITPLIAYPEKVSPLLPRLRTSQLLRALSELDPPLAGPNEQPIDIIHAWGDELIPAQDVVRWAQPRRSRLVLVDDGHRLERHVQYCADAFGRFLRTF